MRQDGVLSYLVPGSLSSVNLTLYADGSTQSVQLYAPYGDTRYSDGTTPTVYGFTGQRFDSTTGLMYYGARYYDPTSGRFISADSVVNNATGDDAYAYVADNPETMNDPTGHRLDLGDGDTIIYRAHHPNSGQYSPPVADDYPTTWGLPSGYTYSYSYSNSGYSTSYSYSAPRSRPAPARSKPKAQPKRSSAKAAAALSPGLIKLGVDLIKNNQKLKESFGADNWGDKAKVVKGTDIVNDNSGGVFTDRYYFTLDDGQGSKVVLSLNYNPKSESDRSLDPWDMRQVHFSSNEDQVNPEKWGTEGYERSGFGADPGDDLNPDPDTSFFEQIFSDLPEEIQNAGVAADFEE